VYNNLVRNVNADEIPGLNRKGKPDYSGLKSRVEGYLSSRTAKQQFEMDVALWYGYLTKTGGEQWKKDMVLRLFSLLYHGGLMVHRERRWFPWCKVGPDQVSKGAPICSSISHTARVLIWLPANEEGNFFQWLWGGRDVMESQKRGTATHGTAECGVSDISHKVTKGAKEIKVKPVIQKNPARHYGVNIALGGNDNKNPISGKGIRENGKHGHLYIAVSKTLHLGRRAMLVSTEQSAPIDRQVAVQGRAGKLKSIRVFRTLKFNKLVYVPDQYGGGHGLGGHSRFSATGGDDFSYSDKPSNLEDYGPSRGNYIDGMFMDLTSARFRHVQGKDFTPRMIGRAGYPPMPPGPVPKLPPRRPRKQAPRLSGKRVGSKIQSTVDFWENQGK
jgi:hypothetical protein